MPRPLRTRSRPASILRATTLGAAIALWAGAAGAGAVRIAGSDSMAPFLARLGEALAAREPGFAIEVDARGSATGPPALLRGGADLAAMTRAMRGAELKAFARRDGRTPAAYTVASDAVAIVVHASNPLDQITVAQLDAIFSQTRRCGGEGEIRRWGDLGLAAPWASRTIGVYASPATSGTRAFVREAVLCRGTLRVDAREEPGMASLASAIAEHRFAIGYATLAELGTGVKALALSDGEGPFRAAGSKGYLLARDIYLYARRPEGSALEPAVRRFLRFALSEEGQRIAEAIGYDRVPVAQATAQRTALE